jgi:hypothetical protein
VRRFNSFYVLIVESIATTNYELEYAQALEKTIFMEPISPRKVDVGEKNSRKFSATL